MLIPCQLVSFDNVLNLDTKHWSSKTWNWTIAYPFGDGSKPWCLVNIKIAGKWMFIPLKCIYRYWPIPISMATSGYLWLLMATYGYFERQKTQLYLSKLGPWINSGCPIFSELRLHKMVPTTWILITISPQKKGSVLPDVAWFLHHNYRCCLHPSQEVRATKLLGTPASCAQDRPMTSWLTSKPRNTTRGHDLVHVYI